jgi:thiamine biosynthesis lipoprotein ApbE
VCNGISSWTKLTGMTGPKPATQADKHRMLLQTLTLLLQTLQKNNNNNNKKSRSKRINSSTQPLSLSLFAYVIGHALELSSRLGPVPVLLP